jgi:hypothetical protein
VEGRLGGPDGSLWSKIDAAVLSQSAASSVDGEEPAPLVASGQKGNRWRFRILDGIASFVWLYAIIKLFVFDFDVYLVHQYLPGTQWILDLKFVFLVVVLAARAAVVRRWWFLGELAYLGFFPLIVMFWKIPRLLYKRRRAVVAFAVLDILTNLVRDYRFTLITSAVAMLAAVAIFASSSTWLLLPAAGLWGVLLFIFFCRAIWRSLNPSRFIGGQVVLLDRAVESKAFSKLWWVNDELRNPEIAKFNSAQLTQFTSSMAMGVLVHRVMYWWAYQLDSYRRSPAPFLVNVLSYLRLFLVAVLAYALINFAIFRADPQAFRYAVTPSLFPFIHYAINVLIAGSADSLSAQSPLAVIAADLAHLTGILFFLTLLATILFSIRSTKQDEALRETVSVFRRRAREFDEKFTQQYEIGVADALNRLSELGNGLVSVIVFFSSRVPADFESDSHHR